MSAPTSPKTVKFRDQPSGQPRSAFQPLAAYRVPRVQAAPLPPPERIGVLQQKVGTQKPVQPAPIQPRPVPTSRVQPPNPGQTYFTQVKSQTPEYSQIQPTYAKPEKYRFQPIQVPSSVSSAFTSSQPSPAINNRISAGDLDEATLDLLRISDAPSTVSFSSTARLSPHSDILPKSASTSSIHKVVRTPVSQFFTKLFLIFTFTTFMLTFKKKFVF